MPSTAEVVIAGGGIVGLSIAYHLAERGLREVLVLERGQAGGGATLKATGGFRLQFATPINVRLSLLALPFWRTFDARFGVASDFRERGYLFLATTPAQVAQLERNVAMQQALAVPVRLVTPAEAAALAPGASMEGILAGAFCPWDATFEVEAVLAGLLADARRAGARVEEGVAVTGVTVAGGRVQGVQTAAGPISAPIVVNAAGPWAAPLAALAGVTVPVQGQRAQAAVTAPVAAYDPAAPMTIDLGSGYYARPKPGGRLTIGGGDRAGAGAAEVPTGDEPPDEAALARMRAGVGARFPALAGVPIERAWAGWRPLSPDQHAILGPTAVGGFLMAAGMAGHGVMHAPAVGRLLAELIVDGRAHSLDIAPLALDRFARGELLTETVLF